MDYRCLYNLGSHPLIPADNANGTYSDIHIKANDGLFGSLAMVGDLALNGHNILGANNVQTALLNGQTINAGSLNLGGNSGIQLEQLSDVNVTNPTNGQALTYNSSTQTWVNSSISGSNIIAGVASLVNSTVTIPSSQVTATSKIICMYTNTLTSLDTSSMGTLYVSAIVPNTSFTVNSNKLNDNNSFFFIIILDSALHIA